MFDAEKFEHVMIIFTTLHINYEYKRGSVKAYSQFG